MALRIDTSASTKELTDKFNKALSTPQMASQMKGNGFNLIQDSVEFNVGPSRSHDSADHVFEIPDHAPMFPMHVDKSNFGADIGRQTVDSVVTKNPESARVGWKYNRVTGKFDRIFDASVSGKFVGDSRKYLADSMTNDAAINLVQSQLFAPANMSWITRPFYQVLSYSKAMEAVQIEAGNNPFASAMNLPLIAFGGGFATMVGAGSLTNVDTFDVDAQQSAMANTVLNFEATYRLTVEEKARQEYGDVSPYGNMAVQAKIKYASWVMDTFRDYLIWYGNPTTDTTGILNVNAVTAWATAGFGNLSLNNIKANNTTNPGYVAYNGLAQALVKFLTDNLNKVDHVKVFVSPLAYNNFAYMPFSSTYNPSSALKILVDNFLSGAGFTDQTPSIEIIPEPMLSPSTVWNANAFDYMVILANDIPGGLNDQRQPTLIAGIPLQKYMFPTVPGTYQTQYKILSRYAGVFAPYTPIVAVYSGFGQLSGPTN
jgi:hypothetical protein